MVLINGCLACDRELQALNISSEPVAKEYLPVHYHEGAISGVKVDLALGYQGDSSKTLRSIRKHLKGPFCPLKKPLQNRFLSCVPVRVGAWGDDAVSKLSVFGSAIIQVVGELDEPERSEQEPPIVVALSVRDHYWQYSIIYREADVEQDAEDSETPFVLYGPWMAGHTSTLLGVFQLVKFIDVLRNWVVDEWLMRVETCEG